MPLLKFLGSPAKLNNLLFKGASVSKGKELIEQGYSKKASVAALGFANKSELCRIFKEVWGLSPQHFSPVYGGNLSSLRKNVAHSQ